MIRTSIFFFTLAILALLFGQTHLAGVTFEMGRVLLFVFLGLAILSFAGGMLGRGSGTGPPA